MPSAARDHRASIAKLTTLAKADLALVYRSVDSPDQARDALLDVLPAIADEYGAAAATLGADYYDELRDAAGARGRFTAIPAEVPGAARAEALARWGVSPLYQAEPDFESSLTLVSGGLQRIIANTDRQTVRGSSIQDPGAKGWIRVGHGECDWCQQFLDGEVHYVEGYDFNAHDHCLCTADPVFEDAETPPHILPDPPEIAPEPDFVEKLAERLRSGEVTPEQLKQGSASASPLGQRNAEEALRVFAAEQEASKAAVVAKKATQSAAEQVREALPTPTGSVAAKIEFPQEALDQLLPSGGWTTATRAKTVARLKETPEGRQLLKTMDSFQSGGSTAIPRLRTDIEKYLAGNAGDMPQGRKDAIENFLSALGRSDAGDRNLFRGMSIPGDIGEVAARYKVGDDLDLSLASFTTDRKLAQEFTLKGAGQKVRAAKKTPVLVEWVGGGKRALPIERLSKSRVFANEKEWVGAGRYAIEGVKRVKRNGVETVVLTIRQKGVW
jgi:hypothetical protein